MIVGRTPPCQTLLAIGQGQMARSTDRREAVFPANRARNFTCAELRPPLIQCLADFFPPLAGTCEFFIMTFVTAHLASVSAAGIRPNGPHLKISRGPFTRFGDSGIVASFPVSQ